MAELTLHLERGSWFGFSQATPQTERERILQEHLVGLRAERLSTNPAHLSIPYDGLALRLLGDHVTVGRSSEMDILLNNHAVSRAHASFERRDGEWYIHDRSSKGVYYQTDREENPVLMGESLRLADGYRFVFAPTLDRYVRKDTGIILRVELVGVQAEALDDF